jgi:hypothetical protein
MNPGKNRRIYANKRYNVYTPVDTHNCSSPGELSINQSYFGTPQFQPFSQDVIKFKSNAMLVLCLDRIADNFEEILPLFIVINRSIHLSLTKRIIALMPLSSLLTRLPFK